MSLQGRFRNMIYRSRGFLGALATRSSRRSTVAVAIFTLCWNAASPLLEADTRKRSFTVKDSIEISQIINPARSTTIELHEKGSQGIPIWSPDGKYFLVVTQRGVLASNRLEGTIWIFSRSSVRVQVLGSQPAKAFPTKLVRVSSTSNTPVIEDVRWIDGSKRVAFLAKDGSPYQRLFVVDVETRVVVALTKKDSYVTAYDVRGDVTVYTTLAAKMVSPRSTREVQDAGDRSALGLLYQSPPSLEDIEEGYLLKCPNALHIQKDGQEIFAKFAGSREPLRLFVPSLSLSPNKKFLIVVTALDEVPKDWSRYHPRFEQFRLRAGRVHTPHLMALESFWRTEQYVIVNLGTGLASPLLDAPAARDMGYGSVPTEAFWLADGRRAVLTNTYVPLTGRMDGNNEEQTEDGPTFVLVDVINREVESSIKFSPSLTGPTSFYRIDEIHWSPEKGEITIRYGLADNSVPVLETYALIFKEWVRRTEYTQAGHGDSVGRGDAELLVIEDLNHPAVLSAHFQHGDPSTIWDPNPQLDQVALGRADLYRWHDVNGKTWSGILALPPDYDTGHRYPLVIQTHGYDPGRFFADGATTTGNGGRALAAREVIVLQMGDSFPDIDQPREALDQVAAFESAISRLDEQGLVDRSRVGIIGFSRTCFHVLYALTHNPGLFKAAAITDGVNFGYVEYVLASARDWYQAEAEGVNGGSPFGQGLMQWVEGAPTFRLSAVQAPLLISAYLKGALLSQWEVYSGLRSLKKPVEMSWWRGPNTPHVLVQPAQRYASQESTVDWFDYWLNAHMDPAADKADQYVRWEALRALDAKGAR